MKENEHDIIPEPALFPVVLTTFRKKQINTQFEYVITVIQKAFCKFKES